VRDALVAVSAAGEGTGTQTPAEEKRVVDVRSSRAPSSRSPPITSSAASTRPAGPSSALVSAWTLRAGSTRRCGQIVKASCALQVPSSCTVSLREPGGVGRNIHRIRRARLRHGARHAIGAATRVNAAAATFKGSGAQVRTTRSATSGRSRSARAERGLGGKGGAGRRSLPRTRR